MASINDILTWFQSLDKPNSAQFAAAWQSFRHKDDKININDLDNDLKTAIQSISASSAFTFSLLATLAERPTTGNGTTLYVVLENTTIYVWNGSYVSVGGGISITPQTWVTNVAMGDIPIGTTINITNIDDIVNVLKDGTTTIFYPALNAPSFSIGHNAGTLRKIGESVNVALAFNFNRGSIYLNGVYQNYRAGAATGYIFYNAATAEYAGMPQVGSVYTVNAYAVLRGNNTFKGKVAYAVGVQPLDSNGAASGTPLAAGESGIQTTSFEGVEPLFATTVNAATDTEQPLVSMLSGNGIPYMLAAGTSRSFAIPKSWTDADKTNRPLLQVQERDPFTGNYAGNVLSAFTATNVTIGGVACTKYTENVTRGDYGIKLIF